MNAVAVPPAIDAALDLAPVAARHAQYTQMSAKWQRCRDAVTGLDALRGERALVYIPKLDEQPERAYQGYLARAVYFNASWRTIEGLCGMLFRKAPQCDAPDAYTNLLGDVTLCKEPIHAFALKLAIETLTVGRVGVLVDYPNAPAGGAVTRAVAERQNMRPVLARYLAEDIINWRMGTVGNVPRLMSVVLMEKAFIPTNEFTGVYETRYRMLDLASPLGTDADGVIDATNPDALFYRQRLFRINAQTRRQEQIGPDIWPRMNGALMDAIPFTFFGVDAITCDVVVPPLIDLIDLNLAHYRVSADYENGCHFVASPTPVVTGYMPPKNTDKLYIGSTSAWVFPDPATRAFFLEFSGAGLGMLLANMQHKETQMGTLGAKLLTSAPRSGETATSAAISHGGESAVLASTSQVLSMGLEQVLTTFCKWAGNTDTKPVAYTLNRVFFPMPLDPASLTSMVTAWLSGAISFETLFDNLQRGEIMDDDDTPESEQAAIKANPPPPPPGTVPTPGAPSEPTTTGAPKPMPVPATAQ